MSKNVDFGSSGYAAVLGECFAERVRLIRVQNDGQ